MTPPDPDELPAQGNGRSDEDGRHTQRRDPSPMSRAASSDVMGAAALPSRRPGTGALPLRPGGGGDDVPPPTNLAARGLRPWQSDLAARQGSAPAGAKGVPAGALAESAGGAGMSALNAPPRPPGTTRPPGTAPARRRRGTRSQPAAGRELTRLGELGGRKLDRRAVVVDGRRIGKLEPGWGFLRRLRSLLILILIVAVVGAAFAALLAVIVEVIGAAANHAISKSAGS